MVDAVEAELAVGIVNVSLEMFLHQDVVIVFVEIVYPLPVDFPHHSQASLALFDPGVGESPSVAEVVGDFEGCAVLDGLVGSHGYFLPQVDGHGLIVDDPPLHKFFYNWQRGSFDDLFCFSEEVFPGEEEVFYEFGANDDGIGFFCLLGTDGRGPLQIVGLLFGL